MSACARARTTAEATALAYCACFVALGMGIALAGPSILQLSAAVAAPVSSVGYIVGLRSLAYLAGGFMGFLFDRLPGHLLIGAALAAGGAATAAVPAVRSLPVLAVALIAQGFFLCIIDAGANVMLLWLMAGRKDMPAWLQALHFCFALGALAAPLALRAAAGGAAGGTQVLPDGTEVVVELAGAGDAAWYGCGALCICAAAVIVFVLPPARKRKGEAERAADAAAETEGAQLAAAAAAAGSLDDAAVCVPGPPPGVAPPSDRAPSAPVAAAAPAAPAALDAATQRSLSLQTWSVVINVSSLFFFYVGCEVGFGLFLTAFAVLSVGMAEAPAQYLTAAYWAAITAGRLAAVPLSSRLAPETMMSLDVVGVLASLALLVVVVLTGSSAGLWLAVVLFGLSMASIYPTGVAILEAFVPLEGKHTTSLVIGGSAGEWLFPLLISTGFVGGGEVADGGGAISISAAASARARWVFLGVNAGVCLGMAAAYVLLRRLGPALRARRQALGVGAAA